jgi:hypothetical protein
MSNKILIIFFAFTFLLFPQEDYRIISSDYNSIVFEYTPHYLDTSYTKIDNQEYFEIVLNSGYLDNPDDWGTPSIPERRFNIGVPAEFGNTITLLNTTYIEKSGRILPKPKIVKDEELHNVVYEMSVDYNNYKDHPEVVTFSDFGIVRGLKSQVVSVHPISYDVASGSIKLYTRIVFSINFAIGNGNGKVTEDNLLKHSVINYNIAKSWVSEKKVLNKVVSNSILAAGEWVRFEAPEEGIYRIDKQMLASFGIDVSVDPRTIKIYNNGGKVLPENIEIERPLDLVENAITIVGEEDGKFDDPDYILFYGRGNSFWDFDEASGNVRRFFHPYSNENYYWITSGGLNGKRIENKSSLNTTPEFDQTSTIAFADFEEDKINIAKSGREHYGDDFSDAISSRTYLNKLDGRISSVPIDYSFRFINASEDPFTLNITENSNSIYNQILTGYGTASYTLGKAHSFTAQYSGSLTDNRSVLQINFIPSSVSSVGYLDYYEIKYAKELKAFDNRLHFFSEDTTALVEYYLNGFSSTNIKVFDVSDYSNVKLITDHVLLSGGDCRFQVSETSSQIRKYISVGNDQYFTPINPETIENSNVRGIQEGAKFIIIAHKDFMDAAENLKSYRENDARLPISTIIVDVEDIFNEFGGGLLDVSAARDFIKYAYDNWQIKPEYVLLFGKGTYDYKNAEGFGDNFIPTWQTQESLILVFGGDSYTSDDFFVRVDGTDFKPDIAMGRITASLVNQALSYVEKVIRYEQSSDKGGWRNLITLVADDGFHPVFNEGAEHTRPSETLANQIIPKSFDIKKIYSADYPSVITGSGRRKPEVNKDIVETLNNGTLLINYIGHGNPELWAHEHIFERSVEIPQLKNDRYFFLCAATCDYGYFDIPNFQSAAEDMIFLPDAGAIAGFNSARLVFSGQNHLLNYTFFEDLLDSERDSLNLTIPLGLAVFKTKQDHNNVNGRKFHLLGDPTLRLQIPQYSGNVDSINGQVLVDDVQVKALSKTIISGKVLTASNQKWEDFNGEGLLTVFDSERTKLLEEINYSVVIQGGVIFKGRVSVTNGEFTASFVVPKDISYENQNGKIIFYFFDAESDGLAYTNKIIVGGTDTTVVNDGEGPEIEILFDDVAYRNAYLVGPQPKLIVKLADETGINTTGTGVGHNMEGILNEDGSKPLDFTNYFTGDLDAGGKSGQINYKFGTLSDGDYNLLVKAWDVFNNFSSQESYFTVVNDDELVIRDVYNYPNPFAVNTTFTFQQNLAKPINVKIKVYTIAGRMIKEIENNNINQKFVKINWDGRDADGDVLGNGTYLYKVSVKTIDGEYSGSVIGKMAVIK